MSRFSIRTRLIILAGLGLLVFLATTVHLTRTLVRTTNSLAEQTRLVDDLETAYRASREFSDMKYWLTDLAVSLLMNAEERARAARGRLESELIKLAAVDSAAADAIRGDADRVMRQALLAVDAYTRDQRVLGNSLMAPARADMHDADLELERLVSTLREDSQRLRDRVDTETRRALRLALALVGVAVIAGLGLTAGLLRSISLPLGRLIKAIDEIGAGNLRAEIPPAGKDEIGAMTRTLGLFRDSLIERERLGRERDEQRRTIETAVEAITDGIVLYDGDDRLVLSNSRFRELYAGLGAHLVPGVSFEHVVRAAIALGLHDLGDRHPDEWVRHRLGEHRDPAGSHVHRHKDDRWIRVTERRTPDGGTVAVYTDITELKEHEEELRGAKDRAEAALHDLERAQSSLVQSEKLALLGQLVAGIAHEIKNPLNFVNNFSSLSIELLEELKEALDGASGAGPVQPDAAVRDEIEDLLTTLASNLRKIGEHGARADSIVRSMLAHSREGSGEFRPADVNALVEESLNLAYHGARAQNRNFNVTLERDYDPAAGTIEIIPQDISRTLLNLFSNGFYATQMRREAGGDPAYEPTVTAATSRRDDTLEIRVRDNGTGISGSAVEKIFNPFFTTKPPGEGTGLGLSLSWDIVVHAHKGTFTVRSQEGEFTEFTVRLPCGRVQSPTREANE